MERYTDSFVAEMAAFVAAIANGEAVPVTGQDGRAPVLMALAGQRSRAENRPVSLAEVEPKA